MGRNVLYGLLLTLALVLTWLLLSGYWQKPLLLGFGAFAVIAALGLTIRLGLLSRDSVPFMHPVRFVRYWAWLGGEIVKANVYVVKQSMKPDLDIQPTMTRVRVTSPNDLARATFANSITLTPGTVTVEVEETGFLVHALTGELADPEAFRDMERHVLKAAIGGRAA
ncbi:cation:proton antiporter [Marinicauda salina]|uniref:Cation:proton antiporter n=1 Tax=Marinicauda salina TaxID=2135793 RepID=A0A2U2BSK6_9PROT|nr:Na+/H+ antiporter subunit E [Marinicauda salina]PWE16994.1 cation:proton antiporter [Marinicauda salina]